MIVAASFAPAAGCGRPAGPLFPRIEPPVVWPAPPERPRIQLVGLISDSRDLRAAVSAKEMWGAAIRGRRPPIRFVGPHTVAISPTGLVAVADSGGGAVHVLDLDRRDHLRVAGWGAERFAVPVGVAWMGQRLFVTDARRHEIIELDARGGFHHRFGSDALVRPVGIAYAAARRRLYVVDGGSHRLAVFEPNGTSVRTIGRRGTAPGEFNFPSQVCARGDRLVVADSGNARVQILDLDGTPLRMIGKKGDGAGDFSFPKGVAFDNSGHLYVVDAHFENIQVYDAEGRLLLAFGREGHGPGEFSLPAGLAIDRNDRIWVADSANHRLAVFDFLGTGT